MLGVYELSLCGIVHNEMYFLPAFLAYYRRIGVQRFIFVDDASTDGTAAFLCAQPDCMLLTSPLRFFEPIDGVRAVYAWRQELLDRFCAGQWSIFADADEFLAPPPGESIASVIARLEAVGSHAIWGTMFDVYPRTLAELSERDETPFDPTGPWFFDAVRHQWRLPGCARPLGIYRGARARLFAENRIHPPRSRSQRVASQLGLARFLKVNNLGKVPLMKWIPGSRWDGAHRITPPPQSIDLLAILHFKFTSDLERKIRYALQTSGYADGSRQYSLMAQLLAAMRANGRDFVFSRSRAVEIPALYQHGIGRWKAAAPGS